MTQFDKKTEYLVLNAITVWQERMAKLSSEEKETQRYSFCPKRFIFGCACTFERKKIQEVLDNLVEMGGLSKQENPNHASEPSYKISKNTSGFG